MFDKRVATVRRSARDTRKEATPKVTPAAAVALEFFVFSKKT